MGVPRDREAYVHRLGRTARANKAGEGWLFLTDLEYDNFRAKLRRLPIKEDNETISSAMADVTQPSQQPPSVAAILSQVTNAYKAAPREEKIKTYLAYLGVLNSRDKRELVRSINQAVTCGWGMTEPPVVSQAFVSKIGLKGVPGMNIGEPELEPSDSRQRSGFGRYESPGYRDFGQTQDPRDFGRSRRLSSRQAVPHWQQRGRNTAKRFGNVVDRRWK
jgi:ATP-dependent RNA helicase MSS116